MTRYEIDSTPRIAPATELDPEVDAVITTVMHGRTPLVLFTTLARDKRLFGKFFGGGLLDRGHLTLRQREIVIDRTTALNSRSTSGACTSQRTVMPPTSPGSRSSP